MLRRVDIALKCIDAGCTLDQMKRRCSFASGDETGAPRVNVPSDVGEPPAASNSLGSAPFAQTEESAFSTTGGGPLARTETSVGASFSQRQDSTMEVSDSGAHENVNMHGLEDSPPTYRQSGHTSLQYASTLQAMEKESCSLVGDESLFKV